MPDLQHAPSGDTSTASPIADLAGVVPVVMVVPTQRLYVHHLAVVPASRRTSTASPAAYLAAVLTSVLTIPSFLMKSLN